ncbi:hypothetical protein MOKP118_22490 [Mycobacterium avium subsp. hominissuis]
MVSTPVNSGGRPDTVTPKTTSRVSVSRDSTSAHAICIRVLTVMPRDRVSAASRAVASAGIRNSVVRGNAVRCPPVASAEPSEAASRVGPGSPARCSRQTRWLACRSRPASQPM